MMFTRKLVTFMRVCLGNERSLCLEDRHRQRLGGRCASSGPDQFSKDLFSYLVFLICIILLPPAPLAL